MKALLLDLDGVLYQGEHAIAGAAAVVQWLTAERIPHLFVTNTTSRPRPALVDKLGGFGIAVGTDAILTPATAAAAWLGQPAADVCMVGDDIRTDVAAAQAMGLVGALVKTGKFRTADLESDIHPDAVLDSIAALPDWWAGRRD
jgi:ribonucleotide monophosphatase NagD (HAD superfamily)